MTQYTVWGLDPINEVELFSSNSQNEAIRWATQYIRNDPTLGGYIGIEVAYYDLDCEYTAIYTVNRDGSSTYMEDYSEQSAISYNL